MLLSEAQRMLELPEGKNIVKELLLMRFGNQESMRLTLVLFIWEDGGRTHSFLN